MVPGETEAFGKDWTPADQIAYWDGCRQTLEEADNRVQQYVTSVLTYIPALAGVGVSVLTLSTAASYLFGYAAALLVGVAGLGLTFEAKSQSDPAFGTLAGAIDVVGRIESRMQLPSDIRMSVEIGKVMARFSPRSRPDALKKRFDLLCYAMYGTFTVVLILSFMELMIHYGVIQ